MVTIQRHNTMFLCISGMVALALAQTARSESLTVWPEAVITGDDVLLRDVCRIDGFSQEDAAKFGKIVVARSPLPGGSIILSIDEVRRPLSAVGMNLATVLLKGAATCDVRRPRYSAEPRTRQKPSAAAGEPHRVTLRDAIRRFFNDELGRPNGRLELRFGNVDESVLDLTTPEFEFRMRRTSGTGLGLAGLDIDVLTSGERVQRVPLLVYVSFAKPVVVSRNPINLKQAVDSADVKLVEMTFDSFDKVGVGELAAVVGKRAKRFIPPGEVIQLRDLEPVPLVRRGHVVDVLSRAGGVSINTAAKALSDGAYGDIIELRVGKSTRGTFSGRVVGLGRVEVTGGAARPSAANGNQLAWKDRS